MRILVAGAGGQLGGAIVAMFRARHDVAALSRSELDITRHAEVLETVARLRPEVVINCAAYNAVDAAEDDALGALEGNALGLRSLARAAEIETGRGPVATAPSLGSRSIMSSSPAIVAYA